MRGIYDEVIFLFGVLGHTHFGIDRDHKIHKRVNAHNYSVTLADWIRFFPHSWKKESGVPKGVISGYIYDWEKRYRPHTVDITGMNQRMDDMPGRTSGSFKITSFKVAKSSGCVVVKYRTSSNHTHDFLGANGTPEGEGWIVLRQAPSDVPRCRATVKALENETQILSDLNTDKFKWLITSQFEDEDALARGIAYLRTYVKNKAVPVTEFKDDVVAPGAMGRLANIAPPGDKPVWVECMEPVPEGTTIDQFWHVPDHALREVSRGPVPLVHASVDVVPIRYKRMTDQLAAPDQLQPPVEPVVPNVPNAVIQPKRTPAITQKRTMRNAERNRKRARELEKPVAAADPFPSASESSADDKELPAAQRLVGTLVYVADIDTRQVWKGKVQGKQKKSKRSGPALWEVDFFQGDTYSYQYKELYATRKKALAALIDNLSPSDSSS